jgi:hypothetical protein
MEPAIRGQQWTTPSYKSKPVEIMYETLHANESTLISICLEFLQSYKHKVMLYTVFHTSNTVLAYQVSCYIHKIAKFSLLINIPYWPDVPLQLVLPVPHFGSKVTQPQLYQH